MSNLENWMIDHFQCETCGGWECFAERTIFTMMVASFCCWIYIIWVVFA